MLAVMPVKSGLRSYGGLLSIVNNGLILVYFYLDCVVLNFRTIINDFKKEFQNHFFIYGVGFVLPQFHEMGKRN